MENKIRSELKPFVMVDTDAPAYWNMDILWIVKAAGYQTKGAFTLIEQTMPYSSGPPPHIHTNMEEMFYILQGEMTIFISDTIYMFKPGTFGFIPRNTVHYFKVTSKEDCKVLNFYTPSGFEEGLEGSTKAASLVLPPKGLPPSGKGKKQQEFVKIVPVDLMNYHP